jgi:hypothetical protein
MDKNQDPDKHPRSATLVLEELPFIKLTMRKQQIPTKIFLSGSLLAKTDFQALCRFLEKKGFSKHPNSDSNTAHSGKN